VTFVFTELIIMAIYVVLASSFDLIIGRGGMFSIAHAAFFALGAYVTAQVNLLLGVPILLAWLVGIVVCAILSLLLGLMALRVTSDYLIIASFGLLTVVLAFLSNGPQELTGGTVGISGIPAPIIFGYQIGSLSDFTVLFLVLDVIVVALLVYLVRSPFGRSLAAIRDNTSAAESLGKKPNTSKLWVFSIAGGFAGLAGAMYASYIGYISPDAFGQSVNTLIFAMVFVGGAGSVVGAVIGAIILTWIPALLTLVALPPELLGFIEQAAYGAILVLIVVLLPGGIAGSISDALRPVLRRVRTGRADRAGVSAS
jgi:branched-chain amino acid transport system permease protein